MFIIKEKIQLCVKICYLDNTYIYFFDDLKKLVDFLNIFIKEFSTLINIIHIMNITISNIIFNSYVPQEELKIFFVFKNFETLNISGNKYHLENFRNNYKIKGIYLKEILTDINIDEDLTVDILSKLF